MTTITAGMVKELRETTGAGMMDCKTALTETNGDTEAAIDWLRTKGLAKAAKKADRVASDGLIGLAVSGTKGAVVEVNSETDFVARNEQFQSLVAEIATLALDANGDLEALARAAYPGTDKSVDEQIKELIGTIGENMSLRRTASLSVENGVVASYVHSSIAPNLGRIGVLVALDSTGNADKLAALGRQIAMHVAATSPLAVTAEEIEPQVIERERAIFTEQARESGKPEEIIAKMVEGRLRKFYEEVALLSQAFVIDPEQTVTQAIKAAEADIGAPVKVAGFVRFALGEGIEKKDDDFASEVAAMTSDS